MHVSLHVQIKTGRPQISNSGATYFLRRGQEEVMATKLNKRAFEHAKNLILKGKYIHDEKDKWSEDQPSAEDENKFIEKNGISEYGKRYLGIVDGNSFVLYV